MKKRFTLISIATVLLFFLFVSPNVGCKPKPSSHLASSSVTFTTSKTIGETIELKLLSNSKNVWIDLNGDGRRQWGEKVEIGKDESFTIKKQTISIYGDLTEFDCSSNQLISLDVSDSPALRHLSCCGNNLSSLDLANVRSLVYLDCSSNRIKDLELRDVRYLTDLDCSDNPIQSLDLSYTPMLRDFLCDPDVDLYGDGWETEDEDDDWAIDDDDWDTGDDWAIDDDDWDTGDDWSIDDDDWDE